MRDIKIQVYLKISEVPRSEYPPMGSHPSCATEEVKQEVEPTPMIAFFLVLPLFTDRST